MKNESGKKEKCKMCGKELPAQYMFKKITDKNGTHYLCCQICYEQFTGKPISGSQDMKYGA